MFWDKYFFGDKDYIFHGELLSLELEFVLYMMWDPDFFRVDIYFLSLFFLAKHYGEALKKSKKVQFNFCWNMMSCFLSEFWWRDTCSSWWKLYSFVCVYTHSVLQSFSQSFFIDPSIHSFIHLFNHLFICFFRFFVCAFIYF